MGRVSVKKDKNAYQLAREKLGLTREKAGELLDGMTAERIEKIESGKSLAHPDEVLIMSKGYKMPELCNYFCARECPIGEKYVPEIAPKSLSEIVLEMLASLNTMQRSRERLIEITSDGKVSDDQVEDFVRIQQELERISVTVEALQLWAEQKVAAGEIDLAAYNAVKQKSA